MKKVPVNIPPKAVSFSSWFSPIDVLKITFRVTNPWKKTWANQYDIRGYNQGWNDCLVEIKRRQKALIKKYEEIKTAQGQDPNQ